MLWAHPQDGEEDVRLVAERRVRRKSSRPKKRKMLLGAFTCSVVSLSK